jgi:hypothetical protein
LARFVQIVKTEPALLAGLVQAVIGLAVGLGLNLTADQTGALLALTTAVLGFVAAIATRPIRVGAVTALVTAIVTLLISFGAHVDPGIVATVNAAIVAIAPLIVRLHVTPVATLNAQRRPAPVPAPPAPAPVPPPPPAAA